MNALAPIPSSLALAARGRHDAGRLPLALDATAIGAAIAALEDHGWASRDLDAQILRALGWQVRRDRLAWSCRHPLQTAWSTLPAPTAREDHAARLVPWGWSRGAGVRNSVPFAWTSRHWPLTEGVPFFETSGLSTPTALCRAALHAQRWLAMHQAPYAFVKEKR